MTLCEKLAAKKFVITSEIGPPKGTDIRGMLDDARYLSSRVDAINVTDLQGSVMRLGSLAACRLLKEIGIEPVLQMTCRDRNRLALQSDLLSASVLGIENVLLLTGDYPTCGDHPEAKPVFDLGSVELIAIARSLQEGKDMNGRALKGTPAFCVGAVVNPGADPFEPELIRMEKKVRSGAQFFQTQAVFDPDIFKKFIDTVKGLNVPILAGIVLLKSAGMARYMNRNISGVVVPDNLIQEMDAASDKAAASVRIASRLITEIKQHCQGIHIMPIGWDKKVPMVLDAAGI